MVPARVPDDQIIATLCDEVVHEIQRVQVHTRIVGVIEELDDIGKELVIVDHGE